MLWLTEVEFLRTSWVCVELVRGTHVLMLPSREEFPARCVVFGPGAVAISSEDLAATHVVVAVSAPVGVARLRGLLCLLHCDTSG